MIIILIASSHFCYLCYLPPPPPPICNFSLQVTSPQAVSQPSSFAITDAPAMPTVNGQVANKQPSNAAITWTAQIKHTAPSGCSGGPQFDSTILTGSGDTFTPNWGSQFYGGTLEVNATCSASGYAQRTTAFTKSVLGTEPSNVNILLEVPNLATPYDAKDLERIACQESGLDQFNASIGTPEYGGGGDAGIMQICFQRANNHLWHWRQNIDRGRVLFFDKEPSAAQWQSIQRTQFPSAPAWTNQQQRLEVIHRYNAGTDPQADHYWLWNATFGIWEANPVGGATGYVTNVLSFNPTTNSCN